MIGPPLQLQEAKQEASAIKVTVVNDGSIREGIKGVTSSMDIAKQLDKKIVKAALASSVDGQIWDLTRPLEGDCNIQILSWEDSKGKDVRILRPGTMTLFILSCHPEQ